LGAERGQALAPKHSQLSARSPGERSGSGDRRTDKARVALDPLIQKQGQIVDQRVRQASATQEGERQGAGALQSPEIDRAGAVMVDRVEVLAAT
jgi:hypothetical protein